MGSESIAHEVKGRMGYWLSGHEGERNCLSKIQLPYYRKLTLHEIKVLEINAT